MTLWPKKKKDEKQQSLPKGFGKSELEVAKDITMRINAYEKECGNCLYCGEMVTLRYLCKHGFLGNKYIVAHNECCEKVNRNER